MRCRLHPDGLRNLALAIVGQTLRDAGQKRVLNLTRDEQDPVASAREFIESHEFAWWSEIAGCGSDTVRIMRRRWPNLRDEDIRLFFAESYDSPTLKEERRNGKH
jgi:aryl carrier-like protein